MNKSISIVIISLILAISAGPGCKTMTPKERAAALEAKKEKKRLAQLRKLKNIRDNEIYIVGKVVLVPALGKDEQDIRTFGTNFNNHIMTFFSGRRVDPFKLNMGMMKDSVNVPIGETFIAKRKLSDSIFYSGGIITLSSRVRSGNFSGGMNSTIVASNRWFIPGGYSYTAKTGAKALYVGTITIYRDKENNILKTKVTNDYKFAAAHFQKTLDTKTKLHYVKPKKLEQL